jgi:hypothetical protein
MPMAGTCIRQEHYHAGIGDFNFVDSRRAARQLCASLSVSHDSSRARRVFGADGSTCGLD